MDDSHQETATHKDLVVVFAHSEPDCHWRRVAGRRMAVLIFLDVTISYSQISYDTAVTHKSAHGISVVPILVALTKGEGRIY